MDNDLNANIHLLNNDNISNSIVSADNILKSVGAELSDSSTLLIYDPEMEMDFDIEPAKNINNVVNRLTSWPLLGVVSYEYKNSYIDISFRKLKEANSIHCVSMSFPEELYRNKSTLIDIKNLIIKLHEELNSIRTVSDVEIESDYSSYNIDDEAKQLSQKKVEGEYWLDILNKSYFNLNKNNVNKTDSSKITDLQDNILIETRKNYI